MTHNAGVRWITEYLKFLISDIFYIKNTGTFYEQLDRIINYLNLNFEYFLQKQVTKKLVSANKKNHETREFYSTAQSVAAHQSQREQNVQNAKGNRPQQDATNSNTSSSSPSPADAASTAMTTTSPPTLPRQNVPAASNTPGSASKRKHRKLAVNFEVPKVSEWQGWGDLDSVVQSSSMWTLFTQRRSSFRWDNTHIFTVPLHLYLL